MLSASQLSAETKSNDQYLFCLFVIMTGQLRQGCDVAFNDRCINKGDFLSPLLR